MSIIEKIPFCEVTEKALQFALEEAVDQGWKLEEFALFSLDVDFSNPDADFVKDIAKDMESDGESAEEIEKFLQESLNDPDLFFRIEFRPIEGQVCMFSKKPTEWLNSLDFVAFQIGWVQESNSFSLLGTQQF